MNPILPQKFDAELLPKIMAGEFVGMVEGMSFEDYKKVPAINQSSLKELYFKSPRHYEASKNEEDEEESDALKIGRAVHAAILEPDSFREKYCISRPGLKLNRKADKDEYLGVIANNPGKEIIRGELFEAIKLMSIALARKPIISQLLQNGIAEVSLFWIDSATTLPCKGRVDYYLPQFSIMVDLKTSISAGAEDFQNSLLRYRYYWQPFWYMSGFKHIFNIEIESFVFLVIEKKIPFENSAFRIDFETIEMGKQECGEAIKKYLDCKIKGEFSGYVDAVQDLRLKDWYLKRLKYET